MATQTRDGFDFYSAVAESTGVWNSLGACTLSSTNTRFGAGQRLVYPTSGASGAANVQLTLVTGDVFFVTFSLAKHGALSGSSNEVAINLIDGATLQCRILINNAGDMIIQRGTTTLATYTGAFSGSFGWSHFQIKFTIGNSGRVQIRKDGNSVDDFDTGTVDTQASANAQATLFTITNAQATPTAYSFDDFWIFDDDASVTGDASDWIGDVRAIQVMPDADTAQADFTPSTGTDHYALVDELVSSGTDYVSSATSGDVDEYANSGITPAPSVIFGVDVRGIGLKSDAGARSAGMRINSNGTIVDSAGEAMATSARTHLLRTHLDPDTSAAWDAAGIAAATFGPKVTA